MGRSNYMLKNSCQNSCWDYCQKNNKNFSHSFSQNTAVIPAIKMIEIIAICISSAHFFQIYCRNSVYNFSTESNMNLSPSSCVVYMCLVQVNYDTK